MAQAPGSGRRPKTTKPQGRLLFRLRLGRSSFYPSWLVDVSWSKPTLAFFFLLSLWWLVFRLWFLLGDQTWFLWFVVAIFSCDLFCLTVMTFGGLLGWNSLKRLKFVSRCARWLFEISYASCLFYWSLGDFVMMFHVLSEVCWLNCKLLLF